MLDDCFFANSFGTINNSTVFINQSKLSFSMDKYVTTDYCRVKDTRYNWFFFIFSFLFFASIVFIHTTEIIRLVLLLFGFIFLLLSMFFTKNVVYVNIIFSDCSLYQLKIPERDELSSREFIKRLNNLKSSYSQYSQRYASFV